MSDPANGLGMIRTASQGNTVPPDVTWCADNECFIEEQFRPSTFLSMLENASDDERDRCRFVVAPDKVGDAAATVDRFTYWGPLIRRELGWPVAFVGQDGAETVSIPWDGFDAWFIGGSTEWKLSPQSQRLAAEARSRGKWVHMGRVNSRRRVLLAAAWGCDSVDGTYITFGPDLNLPHVLAWVREANHQQELFHV